MSVEATIDPVHWTPEQWAAVRWFEAFIKADWVTGENVPPQPTRAVKALLDIAAHATPYGSDEDGFVNGGYLVSVGAMHRAFGVLGHTAAPCVPCQEAHQ